jgi:hypothetical protein|tara:strand:- start:187 stop:546 length:360 start_codon:yes stop_codon:yes gene_type:complete
MLLTLLGVALGFVADDELKAQLLSNYRLLTTHPTAAASQLGLNKNAEQTVSVNQTCGATRPSATQVSVQIYIERYHLILENAETFGFDGYLRAWYQAALRAHTVINAHTVIGAPRPMHR